VRRLGLRIADQETARVVAIGNEQTQYAGAGCLISAERVLTCLHVVAAALGKRLKDVVRGDKVAARLVGIKDQPLVIATVEKVGEDGPLNKDLALLAIQPKKETEIHISRAEFATPFRHGGKSFSVLGFPAGRAQGQNASGTLNAMDAWGLVQMNKGTEALEVEGGYSGAPVWSSDIGAYVGIVVTEQKERGIAWCIPSRSLCEFYPDLPVRFRFSPSDRPPIHDYAADDPNQWLFGGMSDDGHHRMTAKVIKNPDDDYDNDYKALLTFEWLNGSEPRGCYVTFITHPSFSTEDEDAYELFAKAEMVGNGTSAVWKAETFFYLESGFTVAAIANAGDTMLTLDLSSILEKPPKFE